MLQAMHGIMAELAWANMLSVYPVLESEGLLMSLGPVAHRHFQNHSVSSHRTDMKHMQIYEYASSL